MMISLKALIIVILAISFLVFVAFFGRLPALRNTPIAGLHKLLVVRIPNACSAVDRALTGGRVFGGLSWLGNYLMHERHWTVVIFFLIILGGSEFMFLPAAWPRLSTVSKASVSIAVMLPYLFLYLACAADPGYITPENHAYHMSLYPYDYSLYQPGKKCRTCRFIKPARSKHCSICKRCIARADHHCIFINSCVGYGNHHYFVMLLLSTGIVVTYGAVLGTSLIMARMRTVSPYWRFWKPKYLTTGQYMAVWGWGIQDNVNLGATTLLSIFIAPLVWGLLIYTVYLIYGGTTTNESLKWSEWKDDMQDGYVHRRSMPTDRRKNEHIEPRHTRWPVETQQVLITTYDGQPPPANSAPLPGEGRWEKVWHLSEVENLYDLGFLDNLLDVFIPNYRFGNKHDEPVAERGRRGR